MSHYTEQYTSQSNIYNNNFWFFKSKWGFKRIYLILHFAIGIFRRSKCSSRIEREENEISKYRRHWCQSRSGKSNRKFTSWTNIDWSWFGKVRVYFLAMSPPQSGHPCVPKSTSICVISCQTLWQENNNPRSFGFILTYSLLKDCIKNCHSFCYVFILKWKKDKLFFIMKCFRNPDSSY